MKHFQICFKQLSLTHWKKCVKNVGKRLNVVKKLLEIWNWRCSRRKEWTRQDFDVLKNRIHKALQCLIENTFVLSCRTLSAFLPPNRTVEMQSFKLWRSINKINPLKFFFDLEGFINSQVVKVHLPDCPFETVVIAYIAERTFLSCGCWWIQNIGLFIYEFLDRKNQSSNNRSFKMKHSTR